MQNGIARGYNLCAATAAYAAFMFWRGARFDTMGRGLIKSMIDGSPSDVALKLAATAGMAIYTLNCFYQTCHDFLRRDPNITKNCLFKAEGSHTLVWIDKPRSG